jgi:formamidopyrimidine-DNA glycosylase
MPELPEIMSRAKELKTELIGRWIKHIEILQPKCLNLPPAVFIKSLIDAQIRDVSSKGKWILIDTDRGWWLINMGMGGELLLVSRNGLPSKRRLLFDFSDNRTLAINFWWFGYCHSIESDKLDLHPMISKLGPSALEITQVEFASLLQKRHGRIKNILLDQSNIAGIGNAYIHDILFLAGVHPLRNSNSLTTKEISRLFSAIHKGLESSLNKRGAWYELDIYGKPGGFQQADILIGYRVGTPCPVCQKPIEKIQTGNTSSYICPNCQRNSLHPT